ncbi:MAG: VanZ family protein [Spirochaetales bacterium]|nr:VanZ family protein [Spirochaetales bacterium]
MTGTFPGLTVATSALILVAVLLPGSALPSAPGIPGLDKAVHFCLFLALAVSLHLDFRLDKRGRLVTAVVFGLLFSALTEALQLFVDGRASELIDAIADMAGLGVGLVARRPLSGLASRTLSLVGIHFYDGSRR